MAPGDGGETGQRSRPEMIFNRRGCEVIPGDWITGVLYAHPLQILVPNGLMKGSDQVATLLSEAGGSMRLIPRKRAAVDGHWRLHCERCCVAIDGLEACLSVADNQDALHLFDATDMLYIMAYKTRQ